MKTFLILLLATVATCLPKHLNSNLCYKGSFSCGTDSPPKCCYPQSSLEIESRGVGVAGPICKGSSYGCGTRYVPKCCQGPSSLGNESDFTPSCPAVHYPCGTQANGVQKCCIRVDTLDPPQSEGNSPCQAGHHSCSLQEGGSQGDGSQKCCKNVDPVRARENEQEPCIAGHYPCGTLANGTVKCCRRIEIDRRQPLTSDMCPRDWSRCRDPNADLCCPLPIPPGSDVGAQQCDSSVIQEHCVCIQGSEVCPKQKRQLNGGFCEQGQAAGILPVGCHCDKFGNEVCDWIENQGFVVSNCPAGSQQCASKRNGAPVCCKVDGEAVQQKRQLNGGECECGQEGCILPVGCHCDMSGHVVCVSIEDRTTADCPAYEKQCGTKPDGAPICCQSIEPPGAEKVQENGGNLGYKREDELWCGKARLPTFCSCLYGEIVC